MRLCNVFPRLISTGNKKKLTIKVVSFVFGDSFFLLLFLPFGM